MPTTRASERPTNERTAPAGDGKAVITLTAPAASVARRMAKAMGGVSVAEVVRRSLHVLDVLLSLSDDEELVVRNKRTNDIERLRFTWESYKS